MDIDNKTSDHWQNFKRLYSRGINIIEKFLRSMEKRYYRLFFKDGTIIIAYFFGSCDSDNGLDLDDSDFEDLYEFDFIVEKVEMKGNELKFEESDWITLDYRNFFDKFEIYNDEVSGIAQNKLRKMGFNK